MEVLSDFIIDFIQYFINGLTQGSVYALLALGYTLIYGIIKLINFAHGEFFMLGAFIGLFVVTKLHLPIYLVFPVAMILPGILGVGVEYFIYRPLRSKGRLITLTTSISISLLIQNVMQNTVGAAPRSYPKLFEEKYFDIWGILISNTQIFILILSVLLMIGLYLLIFRTKFGSAIRATSSNIDAMKLMGQNPQFYISSVVFLGNALAGAGGVLIGTYYNMIDPLMGVMPGIKSFAAAVVGGIGSIPGAFVGGILLGLLENLFGGLISGGFKELLTFLVLGGILLVRPNGILRSKTLKEKV